jgi:hypothetical protein
MRRLQPSFTKGELSPLLHARVDLSAFAIGLAKLKNFLVLPQGGITRRPGFERIGNAAVTAGDACPVRLIPFVYNSDDAMIIELYDHGARFWKPDGTITQTISSPYPASALRDVRFAQSGNVLFMTHRDHPIQMLRRRALNDWEFEPFEYKNGPWTPPDALSGEASLYVKYDETDTSGIYEIVATAPLFTPNMVGKLIRIDYTISGSAFIQTEDPMTWYYSPSIEIGGVWYLNTTGRWRGTVILRKSYDNGGNWIIVRQYNRQDPDTQGQLEISGSEDQENVLYRVDVMEWEDSPQRIMATLTASGYNEYDIFRVVEYISENLVRGEWIKPPDETRDIPIVIRPSKDWRIGAWGGADGYPRCVVFYQDRLVFACTREQPQAIWMSVVGDYNNFGTSDPLKDDDAITISLTGDDADGIHSLLALSDLLAFTMSGEWRIKGAGENGAISPSAVVAHEQDNIGSAAIQPLLVNGRPVMVQTQRAQVHVLNYVLDMDGYSGSDLSIASSHLFSWKTREDAPPDGRRITAFTYQQIPDSILWFVLEDGTMATCTYQAEHEVVGWARQETAGIVGDIACVPSGGYSQIWAAVKRSGTWGIERLASREPEALFRDAGQSYESELETLRLNLDSSGASLFAEKKLISQLAVYAVRSKLVHITLATDANRNNWRRLKWEYSPSLSESEITLDSGFKKHAAVRIWTVDDNPLTIVALSPMFTVGRPGQ